MLDVTVGIEALIAGICCHFYDSAPAGERHQIEELYINSVFTTLGEFGTAHYIIKALLDIFPIEC